MADCFNLDSFNTNDRGLSVIARFNLNGRRRRRRQVEKRRKRAHLVLSAIKLLTTTNKLNMENRPSLLAALPVGLVFCLEEKKVETNSQHCQ